VCDEQLSPFSLPFPFKVFPPSLRRFFELGSGIAFFLALFNPPLCQLPEGLLQVPAWTPFFSAVFLTSPWFLHNFVVDSFPLYVRLAARGARGSTSSSCAIPFSLFSLYGGEQGFLVCTDSLVFLLLFFLSGSNFFFFLPEGFSRKD